MHVISDTILERYQVRKSRRQKAAFRAYLADALSPMGYTVAEEKSAIIASTNVIIGDVERAKYIFTAHYDTCAVLPVPNFIAPRNLLVTVLYQLFLMLLMFGISLGVGFVAWWIAGTITAYQIAAPLGMLFCLWWLLAGPANRHTANDNTSGVVVLVEAMATLPPEDREKVAFVLFDNEELGLLGSSFFKTKHGKAVRRKLLVNFDCVSDGDHMLFVLGKSLRKNAALLARMGGALALPEGKTSEFTPASKAFYPSDQQHFALAAGVAALKRMRGVGYYLDRIHTPRDTRFDEGNIDILRQFILNMAAGG